jgi:hypothetical protein
MAEAQPERGVTLRAVAFGLCLCVAVSLLDNTILYLMRGSRLNESHMPMANLIICLLSMLVFAALARWFGRWFVFSSTEWITVFCMGFMSTPGSTYGGGGALIGQIATLYYFASPENQWAEYLHAHLPTWFVPTNKGQVMTWFYEGLPQGISIPWEVWIVPLFWWFSFYGSLALAAACVSIIIHRQWSENERLVYPVITPVVEMMTQAGTGKRVLPEFMRGKAFWAGFTLTSFVFWWNMISWFYPGFPTFPTVKNIWIHLPQPYPPFRFILNTAVICFSYFASLEVLFSIWFFDLVFILEGGFLNRIGIPATTSYRVLINGPYMWQTAGTFISLVLWWLWISRRYLRDVFRKALHPDRSPVDDSRELLSYRGATIGLICSVIYMAFWHGRVGMEVKFILVLVPATLFLYLGVAKFLADSGFIYVRTPCYPGDFSLFAFGRADLHASTHAALGMSWFVLTSTRGFAMPVMTHVNRLADFVPKDKRRLFWAIGAAFAVGLTTSTFYTIWLGYTVGGYNFRPDWLPFAGWWSYQWAVDQIRDPKPVEMINYWFFLAGVGFMVFLNLMRYRFTWWPLHPIGFIISGISVSRLTSVTILIAWLIKFVMLKFIGPSFYRKSKPFFIGMLIGYILVVTAGIAVDAIWFPERGHVVHKWY